MKILFIRGDGASFSQVRLWRYTRKRTVSKSVAGRCSWHRLGVARAQAPNNKMRFSFSFHTLCFVCLHTTHQQNHSAASRSGSGDGGNDSNIDVGGGGGSSTSCGGSPCARSAAQHVIVSSTRLYICSIVYLRCRCGDNCPKGMWCCCCSQISCGRLHRCALGFPYPAPHLPMSLLARWSFILTSCYCHTLYLCATSRSNSRIASHIKSSGGSGAIGHPSATCHPSSSQVS